MSPAPAHRTGLAGITVFTLLLVAAQMPLGSTLIAVALPSMGTSLAIDPILVTSVLVTSYLVVNLVSQGPGGKLGDLFGHQRILWIGIALFTLSALVGLAAPGLPMLVLSRCLMAAAGGLVMPATMALFRLHIPAERRGRTFGLFGATMGTAAALGPVLGGELVSRFGWRSIFFAPLPCIALIVGVLRLHPLPARPVPPADTKGGTAGAASAANIKGFAGFDWAGLALMATTLTLLVVAPRLDAALRAALWTGAGAAFIAFLLRERRAAQPVFDLALFRTPAFAAGTAVTSLQNFAMYGLMFQLPQFFEHLHGTPPREVGYTLFAMMIGMVITSPVGGRLTDRIGARRTALCGAACYLLGSLLMCRLAAFTAPIDAALPLLLNGLGLGLCSAPAQSSSMSAVPPARAGSAAGVSSTMRYLGGIAGVLVLDAVLGDKVSATMGRHVIMTWVFFGAVCLSTLACARLPRSGTSAA